MCPLDYALAVAMLTCPMDLPEKPGELTHLASVRPTVQAVALAWEVMDPRETRFVLTRREDYEGDVKLLQRRFADLADAPPLLDCMRFPDWDLASELLEFNRIYWYRICYRSQWDKLHAHELGLVIDETDQLYQVWDLVRDSHCEYYYLTTRRLALKKLREMLGKVDYAVGRLPPHVPLWRFQEIR